MAYSSILVGNDGIPYVFADSYHEAELAWMRETVCSMLDDVDEDDPDEIEQVKQKLKNLEVSVYRLTGTERADTERAIAGTDREWNDAWNNMELFRCHSEIRKQP